MEAVAQCKTTTYKEVANIVSKKNEKEFGISIENKKINLKACDFHFVVVVVNFNLYAL